MKKRKYSSPYFAKDYFSKEILPNTLYAGRKSVRQNLPYRRHDDLEFLLVREGAGTITVNARSIPVRPGTLLCFSPSHFHKMEPEKGEVLEISECHVNAGVFFYISACPYYVEGHGNISHPPMVAQLDEVLTRQVTDLMDTIGESCEKTPIAENQPAFFGLMKLFGILEKYAEQQP